MKNKIIFLLLALFFAGSMPAIKAQNSVSAFEKSDTADNVIIKEYFYPVTITASYYENNFTTVFSYHDASFSSINIPLENYIVRDFVIDNDTVFFCGENIERTGIVGYFEINDLFFNSGNFHIVCLLELPNNRRIGNLTKLVAFSYTDTLSGYVRKMVTVGTEKSDGYGCIAEVFCDNGLHWISTTGYIDNSVSESLLDVSLVKNHIVTVGFEEKPFLSIRNYRKDVIFSLSGIQDNRHSFNGFAASEGRKWLTDNVLVSTMDNQRFATASTWLRYDSLSVVKMIPSIHLAVFDLPSLLALLPTGMQLSSEVIFPNHTTLSGPSGFVSNNTKSMFGVIPLTKTGGSLFFEADWDLSLIANSINATGLDLCGDRGWRGLDIYNGQAQYVMAGRCIDDLTIHTYQVETAGMQSLCMPYEASTINNLTPITSNVTVKGFEYWGYIPSFVDVAPGKTNYTDIEIECNQ